MMTGIKHIVFDLGGVLLNIDYNRTEQEFVKAGVTNFADLYSQLSQTSVFDQFEMGKIGRDEFVAEMKRAAQGALTTEQVLHAWNAMLLDFPLRRLQILQQLQLYYDLVLLSNTNEIHEEAFNSILMSTRGIPNVGVFFDKVYFSHRVGMRKPMREIFERVLGDCGFRAEETLFIDDSPQHIEGAKQLGIQTIYLQKGMTIEHDVFRAQTP